MHRDNGRRGGRDDPDVRGPTRHNWENHKGPSGPPVNQQRPQPGQDIFHRPDGRQLQGRQDFRHPSDHLPPDGPPPRGYPPAPAHANVRPAGVPPFAGAELSSAAGQPGPVGAPPPYPGPHQASWHLGAGGQPPGAPPPYPHPHQHAGGPPGAVPPQQYDMQEQLMFSPHAHPNAPPDGFPPDGRGPAGPGPWGPHMPWGADAWQQHAGAGPGDGTVDTRGAPATGQPGYGVDTSRQPHGTRPGCGSH